MRNSVAFSLLFVWSLAIAGVLTQSQYKQDLQKTCNPTSSMCSEKTNQLKKLRRGRIPRKEKCCLLGRKMAKIGDTCTYTSSLASIRPDVRHFHKMKTRLWINAESPVIKVRLLKKCKRFKAFYEKCCSYESELIEIDLKQMVKRLKFYLGRRRKGNKKIKKEKASVLPLWFAGTNNSRKII